MADLHYIKKYSESIKTGQIPILFLHGFTGSSHDWDFVFPLLPSSFYPVAIDLPGHGKSIAISGQAMYSAKNTANMIAQVCDELNLNKTIVVGYSMGGRAALCFSLEYSKYIQGLFLESSTAGLKQQKERDERVEKDKALANFILNNTPEAFADYWMNIPLFKSQTNLPEHVLRNLREQKIINNKRGMANSLLEFGTGVMPSLWNLIKDIKKPVSLITGSLDSKFSEINRSMNELLPVSEHTVIKNCGHNIHLENPQEFLSVLLLFLRKFEI